MYASISTLLVKFFVKESVRRHIIPNVYTGNLALNHWELPQSPTLTVFPTDLAKNEKHSSPVCSFCLQHTIFKHILGIQVKSKIYTPYEYNFPKRTRCWFFSKPSSTPNLSPDVIWMHQDNLLPITCVAS
jgi:hypothetical protein